MLQIPYLLNILILAPVCLGMFSGDGAASVFQGRVDPSRGLELLVGSLWLSILAASCAGLVWPRSLAPLLVLQVIYKSVWLAAFVAPAVARGGLAAAPMGVAGCFAFIVLVWPFFIWQVYR